MNRGARAFDSLRRRRRTVGRAAWLLFALASAASGAAPCAAMAALDASGAEHAMIDSVHDEHSHARGDGEAHAGEHRHGVGHDDAVSHAHANEHASAPPANAHAHEHAGADGHDAHEPGTSCPHCPLATMAADAAPSSHAHCFVADDASDGGKPSAQTPAAKTVASVPVIDLLPPDRGPPLARATPCAPGAGVASVPLNLRHCVFLI